MSKLSWLITKILKNDNKILFLLIILVIIRGIIYISIIPPWLAPDESAHFEAIRLIGQERLWPTEDVYLVTPMHPEMQTSFEKSRVWQIAGFAPPQGDFSNIPYIYYRPFRGEAGGIITAEEYPLIYHLLLSPVSALSKHLDIIQQLYLLRFFSLLFTTLTIVVSWFFARTIFPERKMYAIALASFLVFLPMHIHINTSVSTDVLTTLLASLYFLLLARIFCKGASFLRVVLAGGFLFMAILTKPTALFIIPTSIGAVIIYLSRRFRWNPRLLILLLVTIVALTFLAGIFLFQVASGGRAISMLSFSPDSVNLGTGYFSRESLAIYRGAVRWGFLSFWGYFGWANIPIRPSWVRMLWIICLLIGSGVAVFLVEHILNLRGKSLALKPYQKDLLLVLLLSLIFALISIYTPIITTQAVRWSPQSRYFFPALIPFALYFFLGFQQLIPARLYHLALPVWLTGLIFFDSITIAFVLIPFIYG